MRAHEKNGLSGFIILQKGADPSVSQLLSQGHFGGTMTQPSTIVDMVVADDGTLELL